MHHIWNTRLQTPLFVKRFHKCHASIASHKCQCADMILNWKECLAGASTRQGVSSCRDYFSYILLVSIHEWVGVIRYENKLFHKWRSQGFFFLKSKMWLFNDVLMQSIFRSQGVTLVTVNVWDVLQLCQFIADTSDANTFRQMSHLSETTTGNVSDSTWHVSTWDNILVILERLHFGNL